MNRKCRINFVINKLNFFYSFSVLFAFLFNLTNFFLVNLRVYERRVKIKMAERTLSIDITSSTTTLMQLLLVREKE